MEKPMQYRLNRFLNDVAFPPISEAQSWAMDRPDDGRELLDIAQAVPGYPPAELLRNHLAGAMDRPELHRYTDVFGFVELRRALADHFSAFYDGEVGAEQVGIVAGCNQAFCLATSALAGEGDEIILPVPYYFNHQMWLQMQGIRPVYLPAAGRQGGVPDPGEAAGLITERTRAIVLITPNNPTGAVCPPATLEHFYDLARDRGIALIVDETYKDFLDHTDRPHDLFRRPDWDRTLVHLYSFSKVYSLSGHRVGSISASPALLDQIVKAADCVAICPPAIGQEAALFALRELDEWRETNRRIMADRVVALKEAFARDDLRYELGSAGAYFAYVHHPFTGQSSFDVARRLAHDHGVITLPGEAFGPGQEAWLRFAFANLEADVFPKLVERLIESQGQGG